MENADLQKPQPKKIVKYNPPSKEIQELIATGIPLRMAVFHRAVLSFGDPAAGLAGTPETAFHVKETDPKRTSAKPARTAEMWYTPHGVVTAQRGIYKLIPLANISDTTVL